MGFLYFSMGFLDFSMGFLDFASLGDPQECNDLKATLPLLRAELLEVL